MKPCFSILIPVYNAKNYLSLCIESILAQKTKNMELLLLDDGSDDESYDICRQYAEKYTFIHAWKQENKGPLLTRKRLIELCQGEYCIFADADDYLDKSFLDEVQKALERHPDCDLLCFGSFRVFANRVYPSELLYETEKVFQESNKKQLYELAIQEAGLFSVWAKAFRRELVTTEGYRAYGNIRYGEDRIQVMQMLLGAEEIVYLPKRLYYYRATEGSLTQEVKIKRFENMYGYTDALEEFMKKAKIYTKKNCQIAYTSLLSDLLDSLLKYNTSKKSMQGKLQELKLLRQLPYYKILQKKGNPVKLPLYHRIRYWLLEKEHTKILLYLDQLLFAIKRVLERKELFGKTI